MDSILDSVFVVGRNNFAVFGGTTALVFLCFFIAYRDGRAVGTRSRPDLSTVPGIPFFGNIFLLLRHGERQLELFTAIRKTNKDLGKNMSLTVPGHRFIDITRPSWIAHVQKTNFTNYQKGPTVTSNLHDFLGEGVFVSDGDIWKSHRKATTKVFAATNFRGFITTTINAEIAKLKLILGRYADSGEQFDLASLFARFALESSGAIIVGTSLGALSLTTDVPVPFAAAFDYAHEVMFRRFANPLWKWTERISGDAARMRQATALMNSLLYGAIEAKEKFAGAGANADGGEYGTDMLSIYMGLKDDNGEPLSHEFIRDSLMNLLVAGRDSTAQSLSWTFFHLLSRPELIEPIRAEIDSVGTVDYDNHKDLVETTAVFHEGLRLHPPVPKNAWQAIADDHLPDGGPMIEAGDVISWCDWEMARFPEIWGADASEFNPSRWIDEKHQIKKESVWKAHFFNGGARACVGKTLATYEATSVMASIVAEFDLKLAPGYLESVEMVDCENTPRYSSTLMLPMKAPLLVTVTRRKV
ncbi:hypothetical protein RQP46_010181 [Phenoliferia psychrophenolica]